MCDSRLVAVNFVSLYFFSKSRFFNILMYFINFTLKRNIALYQLSVYSRLRTHASPTHPLNSRFPWVYTPSPPPNFTSFSHALNSITYVFCWVLHLKSWLFLASFVNVPNVPGTASVISYSLLHFRIIVRSSHQRHSMKKMFLEISQNSQENTCARASF